MGGAEVQAGQVGAARAMSCRALVRNPAYTRRKPARSGTGLPKAGNRAGAAKAHPAVKGCRDPAVAAKRAIAAPPAPAGRGWRGDLPRGRGSVSAGLKVAPMQWAPARAGRYNPRGTVRHATALIQRRRAARWSVPGSSAVAASPAAPCARSRCPWRRRRRAPASSARPCRTPASCRLSTAV